MGGVTVVRKSVRKRRKGQQTQGEAGREEVNAEMITSASESYRESQLLILIAWSEKRLRPAFCPRWGQEMRDGVRPTRWRHSRSTRDEERGGGGGGDHRSLVFVDSPELHIAEHTEETCYQEHAHFVQPQVPQRWKGDILFFQVEYAGLTTREEKDVGHGKCVICGKTKRWTGNYF